MKTDERHSGPRIFGSIIKNPPIHKVTRGTLDLQFDREWHSLEETDPMGEHESVRYPSDTNDD